MRVDGFRLANVPWLLHVWAGAVATCACGGTGPVDTSVREVTTVVPEATAPIEPDARAVAEPSAIAGGALGGRSAIRTAAEVGGSPESLLCSEGEVVAILEANSRGRLDVGNSVRDRLEGRDARAVAEKIITDEAVLLVALQGATRQIGVTPSSSTYAAVLAAGAQAEIRALGSKSGADLDASYISEEVRDHFQTLGLIELWLAPSAQDKRLQGVLARARDDAAQELQVALAAQARLGGGASP